MISNNPLKDQISWLSGVSTYTDTGFSKMSAGTTMITGRSIKYFKLALTPEDLSQEDFGEYTDVVSAVKRSLVFHNNTFKRTTFTIKAGNVVLADAHLYGMPIQCSLCANTCTDREILFLMGAESETPGLYRDFVVCRYTFCAETCLNLFAIQRGIGFSTITWK